MAEDKRPKSRENDASAESSPPRSFRMRRLAPILVAGVLVVAVAAALISMWAGGESVTGHLLEEDDEAPPAKIEVDAAVFKDYFTVEHQAVSEDGRALIVSLSRAKGFPLREADYERIAEGTSRLGPLLAYQRIAEGYVRCEYFTNLNEFLGFTFERIESLKAAETAELALPIASFKGVHRIVIRY